MPTNYDVPEGYKRCRKCEVIQPLSEFSPAKENRDSLHNYCKACSRADAKARRAADPEKYLQKARERRRRNPEAANQLVRDYRIRNRDRLREKARNRHRDAVVIARHWVSYNVRRGNIPKVTTLSCAHCGAQAQQYHHPDYSKPDVVTPLCRRCHNRVHGRSID